MYIINRKKTIELKQGRRKNCLLRKHGDSLYYEYIYNTVFFIFCFRINMISGKCARTKQAGCFSPENTLHQSVTDSILEVGDRSPINAKGWR